MGIAEPAIQNPTGTPYDAWVLDPTPDTLYDTVQSLDPVIRNVMRQIGAQGDPNIYSKARVLAARAVETYDPSQGVQLKTWTSRQLLPLRRERRLTQGAVRVPDSVQLDAMTLHQASLEFEDEHGREPDLLELSDASKIPLKRIKKVRRMHRMTPSDSVLQGDGSEENPGVQTSYSETDFAEEAMDYIYHDADRKDRLILEHMFGYGGGKHLTGAELAVKLNASPAQVSRRAARLRLRVGDMEQTLREVAV